MRCACIWRRSGGPCRCLTAGTHRPPAPLLLTHPAWGRAGRPTQRPRAPPSRRAPPGLGGRAVACACVPPAARPLDALPRHLAPRGGVLLLSAAGPTPRRARPRRPDLGGGRGRLPPARPAAAAPDAG